MNRTVENVECRLTDVLAETDDPDIRFELRQVLQLLKAIDGEAAETPTETVGNAEADIEESSTV